MFSLILIPHRDVTESQIEEIVRIKSVAWLYDVESQHEWLNSNLLDTDIHVLLRLNEKNIAYLNLINIIIKIDGVVEKCYGVGNVCSSEKGKNFGKKIMAQISLYLLQKNMLGLLFCNEKLIKFYSLCAWNLIEKEKVKLFFNSESVETMIYNCNYEFQKLEYSGRAF
jgi:hypothetical protein